jgi:hypothetical protein
MLFATTAKGVAQKGMSVLMIFLIVLIFICLIFGIDLGYIFYTKECMDESLEKCAQSLFTDEEETPAEGTVAAVGTVSGEYGGEERSVTFTFNIPLEGGSFSGSFDGDCEGKISGEFAGGNGGGISGKGNGSCAFVMPASGEFRGTVNTLDKEVIISGSGKAAAFSGEGSLTLTYK